MVKSKTVVYAVFAIAQSVLMLLLIYNLHENQSVERKGPREYDDAILPYKMRGAMHGCPVDSTLEFSLHGDSGYITRVCRSKNEGDCAKGWQKLEDKSTCVNNTQLPNISPPKIPTIFNRSSVRQPEYAPISDERKLLFIHIPKAGGTTIETSFLFDDRRKELHGAYLGGHNKITAFDEKPFKSYHKFSMVRHPCSRLISIWSYYSQQRGNKGDREWVAEHLNERSLSSFEVFVMEKLYPDGDIEVTNQVHLQPQVNMIFDQRGNFALDQLLVFEKWNESFDALSKRIHVDLSQVKTTHKLSSKHDDCKSMYTLKTWEKLTQLYAMDFCVLGYSSNINEISTTPSLDITADYLTQRYKECKETQNTANFAYDQKRRGLIDKNVQHSDANSDECIIYTYFEPVVPNNKASDLDNEQEMITAWKSAWSVAGWTPRVLTEADARLHPNYSSLRERFWKLPTVNSKKYEMSCFMRHVAMAAIGGGWMSDYDVIPFYFPRCTEPLNDGMYTVYMGYTPSLVSASSIEYSRVANRMANVVWEDWPQLFSYKGKPHVSDMIVIQKLIEEKAIRTMKVVIEAKKLCNPFSCKHNLNDKSIPKGMPSLPWAIHFSHNSLGALRKDNLTSFWPGSSWSSYKLNESIAKMRPALMTEAFNYIRKACLTEDENSK